MAQNRDKRKVIHFSKFLEFGTVKPCLAATLVIRLPRHYGHFFGHLAKTTIHFLVKKTLINTTTPLIWPNVFGPLVAVLTGFHCSFLVLPTGAITRHKYRGLKSH